MLSGTMVGPYRIEAKLGEGGMGEVYKARDTRLDRTVAIKVLPAELAADPDRLKRFEREAKTIAGLSHPHICTLHDIGTHDGTTYLVMEHLQGDTLADRLLTGRFPLDQALTVATEIADALAAAHRQGIIHRDLKPGNVMLTKAGAKLLDFGLAKLTGHGAEPAAMQLASVATRSAPLTAEGTIVGTLQYMAPEQVEGKAADARTDLWALGAIVYEMLTGKRAFEGTSAASLIGSIMSQDPAPVSALQPESPPGLDRLVRRCLAKAPDDRPDTAHDVADELRWLRDTNGPVIAAAPRAGHGRFARFARIAAALVVAGLLGAWGMWAVRDAPSAASVVLRAVVKVAPADRLQSMPEDTTIGEQRPSQKAMALSPDGRLLVFTATAGDRHQLYVRRLDRLEATAVPDTDGASDPFFSPDGQWIGFWARGALRKVPAAGGPATTICDTAPIFGASWAEDGTIVFANQLTGLFRVSAEGGVPAPLTTLDEQKGEASHRLPHALPGGKAVLFTSILHYLPDWDQAEIVALRVDTGDRKAVTKGADARYLPTGHLVFVRTGTVVAAPFDLNRLEIMGGTVTVLNDVMQAANTPTSTIESGAGQFATASTGLAVYVPGGLFPDQERLLVWVGRDGRETPVPLPPRAYLGPHLSPDGQSVLVWTQGRERIVWLYDVRRGTMTRVTGEGRNSRAIWTPDGRRVTYAAATSGTEYVFVQALDSAGTVERLPVSGMPSSWSPDGEVLAFARLSSAGVIGTIGFLAKGKRELIPFGNPRFNDRYPEFSHDGEWIAYTSNRTGRDEVYAQAYPGPGEQVQLSSNGGTQPCWSRDGRELFYTEIGSRTQHTKMMSVPISAGRRLVAGVPRVLFEGMYRWQAGTRGYDVSADGRRFLMVKPVDRPPSPVRELVLIQNWFEELKAKVPVGGAK